MNQSSEVIIEVPSRFGRFGTDRGKLFSSFTNRFRPVESRCITYSQNFTAIPRLLTDPTHVGWTQRQRRRRRKKYSGIFLSTTHVYVYFGTILKVFAVQLTPCAYGLCVGVFKNNFLFSNNVKSIALTVVI